MAKTIYSLLLLALALASAQAALVSWDEFVRGVTSSGYPGPKRAQYDAFIHRLPAGQISTKREAAMFLAEILWESGGLRYKRELACIKTGCPGRYDNSVGDKGKNYYGRGYIQLTHSYNYKAASLALYNDLRLIHNPDLVATSEDAAWGVSFWFWKVNVHSQAAVRQGQFGAATRAINGAIECHPGNQVARKRFEIYKRVLIAFNDHEQPNEHGCYN